MDAPAPAGGSVAVPGVGKVRKTYVLAGVAITGVFVIMYYRKHGAAGAAAVTVTDPDGNVCAVLNPATGFCPGTPGDLAAQGFAAGTTDITGGTGGGTQDVTGTGSGPPFASNAAWSQYAAAYLTGTENRDPVTVGADLGAYVTGQPLDPAAHSLISDAIAIAGYPPVSGADGFPPAIRLSGPAAGGKVYAVNPVTGLKAAARYTQADASWHPARNAAGYRVTVTRAGARVSTTEVTGPAVTLHDLKEGTSYQVRVLALPANSAGYSNEASVSVTTKRSGTPLPVPDIKVALPK